MSTGSPSLRIGVPLGHYDEDRLLNIGTNRWSFKPELGISKTWGRWIFETDPSATFFTENDDYFGGNRREQDPIDAVQGHVEVRQAGRRVPEGGIRHVDDPPVRLAVALPDPLEVAPLGDERAQQRQRRPAGPCLLHLP